MNYRHIYHAGNFADVFKHWVLTLALAKLTLKTAPLCLVDLHAGLGAYDLTHPNAQATLEYQNGIIEFLNHKLNQEFQPYATIVQQCQKIYNKYPGSPYIMQEYLRKQDKLILCELHPEDYLTLKEFFAHDKRIQTINQDAYQCLKAKLPPPQRRAIVLIDPAFEKLDEFSQLFDAIKMALKRFATGTYIIWYPIKDIQAVNKFYNEIQTLKISKSYYIELHTNKSYYNQLKNCGLLIINPPWQLDNEIINGMPKLLEYLNAPDGAFKLEWLHEEN